MHIPWYKRMFAPLLLLCLPLLLWGCGSGGGGAEETTLVSGLATKGPIRGALVQINQLTPGGAPGALLGTGTSAADGSFAVAIPAGAANGPLLVTVTGRADGSSRYLSESTGSEVPFGAGESFRAALTSGAVGASITASPLSETAYQKLQQVLTENPALATPATLAQAVGAVNARIGALTGVADILADPAGDPRYRAMLQVLDRMIVDQGAQANTGTLMNVLNQAYLDVNAPGYQEYLVALNTAAAEVKAANPGNNALAADLDQIRAVAANPRPEPDFTDTTAPTPPSNLVATPSALSASAAAVVLTWNGSNDNDRVAGYEVFRDGARIATVLSPGFTDSTVSFNATFSYVVVAFDAAGNRSAASNQATATPIQPPLDVTVGGQVGSDVFGFR